MKVYLDDIRNPSDTGYYNNEWTVVRTVEAAIDLLRTQEVLEISLDHDLGACMKCMAGRTVDQWLEESNYQTMPHCKHVGTGYDVILWIEEKVFTNEYKPPIIYIHTANSSARAKMEACREQILNFIEGMK